MDAETIERLRQSGIRIDRDGEFQHEGEPVRHQGLRQALFRWLDRLPDGRVVLRLDADRFAYVDVDDTPLVARGARLDADGRVYLALSDGSEEPLDPGSLSVDGAGILRCEVRGGKLSARLATSASVVVASLIDDSRDGPTLTMNGARFPLRTRP